MRVRVSDRPRNYACARGLQSPVTGQWLLQWLSAKLGWPLSIKAVGGEGDEVAEEEVTVKGEVVATLGTVSLGECPSTRQLARNVSPEKVRCFSWFDQSAPKPYIHV